MKVIQQPDVNIGMIGHVDHGKTTLTKVLTHEYTDRHSEELKRGISIRLGYANANFYECPKCDGFERYTSLPKCKYCEGKTEFIRSVSFVDAPGHEMLMAVMLSGAAVMHGAMIVIAANEPCPQAQTREHLVGVHLSGVKDIIIVQNKIDLVSESQAMKNYDEIKEFVKGTIAENSPIIPISANHDVNIDALIAAILEHIPFPKYDLNSPPLLYCLRSFDINRPGSPIDKLKGGVIGGSLIKGKLKIGDEIEIKPGRAIRHGNKLEYEPITTEVVSLNSGELKLKEAGPGGLIAIGTKLDPALTKADSLSGQLIGKSLPETLHKIDAKVELLDKVVGVKEDLDVLKIKSQEPLLLTIGSATNVGVVTGVKDMNISLNLKLPVCIYKDQKIAISRRFGSRWRLIGSGVIE